jgi:PHD/YefM family antitoxin component YafN of YafNO toxin-antitoxin module
MTKHTLSISEAQRELTRLPEQFEEESEAVTVTRYGKPVMAILPYNTYMSLLEALEALECHNYASRKKAVSCYQRSTSSGGIENQPKTP